MALVVTLGVLALLALIYGVATAGPSVLVLVALAVLLAAVEPQLHRRR